MRRLLASSVAVQNEWVNNSSVTLKKINQLGVEFPSSYVEFVSSYGGIKSFRQGLGFLLIVYDCPRFVKHEMYGGLYCFGSYDDLNCFFVVDRLGHAGDSGVYVIEDDQLIEISPNFESWFVVSVSVLEGHLSDSVSESRADEFSVIELAIVRNRKQFTWKVLGSRENRLIVQVNNNSHSFLKRFTLGVRSKVDDMHGAVAVDVSRIAPGSSDVAAVDCYSDLYSPDQVELVDMPDPTPETASNYFEFD